VKSMGNKTISLDEEAYNRLKKDKNCKESFSDVIKRLTRPIKRKSLLVYAGIWNLTVDEQKIMMKALKDLEGQFDDMSR